MGLFGRKTQEQRQQDGFEAADRIAQGRGLTGRMTKMLMGQEFTDRVGGAVAAARAGQQGQAMAQQGMPSRIAQVTRLADTGQSVNDNPIVELGLDLDGQAVTLRTLVSRIEIPRVGERVFVMDDPSGAGLLYGGIATTA
ncbi:MAG: hypothetical protein ACTHZX_09540 [Microbacterium sp.]